MGNGGMFDGDGQRRYSRVEHIIYSRHCDPTNAPKAWRDRPSTGPEQRTLDDARCHAVVPPLTIGAKTNEEQGRAGRVRTQQPQFQAEAREGLVRQTPRWGCLFRPALDDSMLHRLYVQRNGTRTCVHAQLGLDFFIAKKHWREGSKGLWRKGVFVDNRFGTAASTRRVELLASGHRPRLEMFFLCPCPPHPSDGVGCILEGLLRRSSSLVVNVF